MRVVTVFSTIGKNGETIETNANLWSELKNQLLRLQSPIKTDGMKVIHGETKATFEHPDAVLPEGDFTLFLMPVKTKSGAMDRKDLFEKIKAFVGTDATRKALFTVDGKNMTQLKTDFLEELYHKHIGGVTSAAAPVPAPKATPKATPNNEVKEAVAAVVGSIKTKGSELEAAFGNLSHAIATQGNQEVNRAFAQYKNVLDGKPAISEADKAAESNKAAADAEAKRLAEEKRKKNAELEAKARDIAKGLSGISSF
jgi:hypothetical protein